VPRGSKEHRGTVSTLARAAGMTVASAASVRFWQLKIPLAAVALLCTQLVFAAATDSEAQKARKKPLQRCDQLKGNAELECLQKARERVVESRQKRQESSKGEGSDSAKSAGSTKSAESAKPVQSKKAAESDKAPPSKKAAESDKGTPSQKTPASGKSSDADKSEPKK
jgi:hypothetical protein